MRGVLAIFLSMILQAAAIAGAVSGTPSFKTEQPGEVLTIAEWNTAIPGLATYLNNNVAATMNVLSAKGSMYVGDGSSILELGVGSNGQIVQADSALGRNMKWATFTGTAPMTTKGDLVGFGGSTVADRLGVGTNTQVLTVDLTQPLGLKWSDQDTSSPFPRGSVVSWSPAAAGTSTIPSGWVLCDGTNSSPNLIGRFVIGTRPNGSGASPSAGGFGAKTVNTNGGASTTSHSHVQSGSFFTTTDTNASIQQISTTTPDGNASGTPHTHTVTISGSTVATAPSTQMADYSLVYIMKT